MAQVPLKGRACDRFEKVPAQIERAQLGEREAGLEPLQHLTVEAPADAAVLVMRVVERETRLLQGGEIASNRPGGDLELLGERLEGDAVPRRLERVQDPPLPDDFLISRHDPSYL